MKDSRRHRGKTQQQHARRAGAVRHAGWTRRHLVSSPQGACWWCTSPLRSCCCVWEACAACGKYHRDNYTGPCDNPRESFTLGAGTDGTLQLY
jgi:hypothetical protein